jgi:carbon-monoxide dehydrogenase medium subunit
MVIAHDFEYVLPESLEDALAALAEGGSGARVLAGGTDVVPWLRDDLIEPKLLVDIKAIPGLGGIVHAGRHLTVGALVTFSDLVESDLVRETAPMLAEMAEQVASIGIRNRATVVGNLCSAVPSLDAGPALLVYDAVVTVAGDTGIRRVPLSEWFVGPKDTRLAAGEMVTEVTLTLPAGPHGAAFLKLARYAGEDLAQANLAVLATSEPAYRLAFGAVAPRPFRAETLETFLDGKTLDDDRIASAKLLLDGEIAPITDVRASAEYRTHMCRVMLERGLRAAVSRLSGAGPPYPTYLI